MKSHYSNRLYKIVGMVDDGEGALEALAIAAFMVFLTVSFVALLTWAVYLTVVYWPILTSIK